MLKFVFKKNIHFIPMIELAWFEALSPHRLWWILDHTEGITEQQDGRKRAGS